MNFRSLFSDRSTLNYDIVTNVSQNEKDASSVDFSVEDDDVDQESEAFHAPAVFYLSEMKFEQCVRIDLMMMIEESDCDAPVRREQLTPIPKFIAYLVMALRAKFETELKLRVCFLEADKFPEQRNVQKMADHVYHYSKNMDAVLKVTRKASALLLFCTLLELLQRFECRLLQFSKSLSTFIRENPVAKYCRPFDYVIKDHCLDFIEGVYMKTETTRTKMSTAKKVEDPSLTKLGQLVNSYYIAETGDRTVDLIFRNQFHILLYGEFRQTHSTMQRYICKFILRNCLYIIRRYVCSVSARLRLLRKESWDIMLQTVVPQISTFAINKMSEFLACTITEIFDEKDSTGTKVKLLDNIFSIHMESLWFRRKKTSDLIVNIELPKCHKDCLCGMD